MRKDKDLVIFTHEIFGSLEVYVNDEEGRYYFPASEVAKALGFSNPVDKVNRTCKGIVKFDTPTCGGKQTINVIPEGDLYRLIVSASSQSKNLEIKQRAEEFESWVFDKMLPSLRQDGLYINEGTTNEQKLYHPQMLELTFRTCGIEDMEQHYEKCIAFHKEKKTRLPYLRSSDNRRSDKKKTIAESKVEIMTKIEKVIKERQTVYIETNKFEFANVTTNLLKNIKDDIWKVRHNRTKGKLAATTKTIENKGA
jgi:prophage antirepressor-like protein